MATSGYVCMYICSLLSNLLLYCAVFLHCSVLTHNNRFIHSFVTKPLVHVAMLLNAFIPWLTHSPWFNIIIAHAHTGMERCDVLAGEDHQCASKISGVHRSQWEEPVYLIIRPQYQGTCFSLCVSPSSYLKPLLLLDQNLICAIIGVGVCNVGLRRSLAGAHGRCQRALFNRQGDGVPDFSILRQEHKGTCLCMWIETDRFMTIRITHYENPIK